MNSKSNLEKFPKLLGEFFQFNCADLDFGIYRIMNYKRNVIEQFIPKAKALEPVFKGRMFSGVEV